MKVLFRDFIAFCILLCVCFGFGFLWNLHLSKLPHERHSEEAARFNDEIFTSKSSVSQFLSLEEFRSFVDRKRGLILDARPKVFFQYGHVPGALSLPLDSFQKSYEKLKTTLQANRNQPIAIYCSGGECNDSTTVQQALRALGYTNVAVFRGGWDQWTEEQLPTTQH